MKLVRTIKDLNLAVTEARSKGNKIGFVPTMGALHKGHLSLVEQAAKKCTFVVVSIFVNPTQFNDRNDLKRYPRDLNRDLELLRSVPCKLVFAPEVKEMYPNPDTRKFNFGPLEEVMEGTHRPGHFNGVAQIVSKLFDFVKPDCAFFGQKDFQQLVIIKELVHQMNTNIEIIPCPIIRENDGLAMSSRNQLLSKEQRKSAALISKVLFESRNKAASFSVNELKKWVIDEINKSPLLDVEYFDIVDDIRLEPVISWKPENGVVGCIAVQCGAIRLIDNITYNH